VGPIGTMALRLLGGSVALSLATKPWQVRWSRTSLRAAAVFATVLVTMNAGVYLALDRLPLATVITLEFLGPLGISVVTAAGWRQRAWALPTAVGVALIGGTLHTGDVLGVAMALMAALSWAAYIVLSRRMGSAGEGLAGLCLASIVGAVVMVPIGFVVAGTSLLSPGTLSLGLLVGVMSSAIPYSLDLLALRRLPTAVFGVLVSLNPAVAALAGLIVLGQHLPAPQLVGIVFVIAASGGITVSERRFIANRSDRRLPDASSDRRRHHSTPPHPGAGPADLDAAPGAPDHHLAARL
jgi:inner membrane transporter RhtA